MQNTLENFNWRSDLVAELHDYIFLTMGALILALNFNIFMAPNEVAPGGISGLTLVLARFVDFPKGMIMLSLQTAMVLVGFRFLGGGRFVMRVIYSSLLYSLSIEVLGPWLPQGITSDTLLNTFYGGMLGGVGVGLIFRGHGSLAGTTTVSRVLQLKTGVPTSQLYLFVDGGIILTQALILGWDKALYGLIMLFIWGLAVDYVMEGPSRVRTLFIITDQPHSVSTKINSLGIGVTSWGVRGMFSHKEHTTLFCTVRRTEINQVKALVNQVDPQAYWVIGQGHQAKNQ